MSLDRLKTFGKGLLSKATAPAKAKVEEVKQKAKTRARKIAVKAMVIASLLVASYGTFWYFDKYHNEASATQNLQTHFVEFYGYEADMYKCPDVSSERFENRVVCQVRFTTPEGVKREEEYLCRGLLDALDNSCIRPVLHTLGQ
ncbi:hypothetical protein [Pseudoalteromonas phage J2-1_QLiu-2017]|nr:hypothetical protein [Pseudoalteromonas phage J2-1_QLiu-2017]